MEVTIAARPWPRMNAVRATLVNRRAVGAAYTSVYSGHPMRISTSVVKARATESSTCRSDENGIGLGSVWPPQFRVLTARERTAGCGGSGPFLLDCCHTRRRDEPQIVVSVICNTVGPDWACDASVHELPSSHPSQTVPKDTRLCA